MTGRIEGEVAIITGAGEGLGRAIALRFAEEGARLVLVELDPARLAETQAQVEALGAEVETVAGDATSEATAQAAAQRALVRWGRIEILVNNVGGARVGRVWDMALEDWEFTLKLNLNSMFLFSKAVLPTMMAQGYGRIVCMSSGAREGTPWTAMYAGGAAYSTSKAGVHGFLRDLSMEVAEHGITVNAVAPGPIDTAIAGPHLRKMDEAELPLAPSRLTPMRRLGTPVEVAHAVLFLASQEASYITGVTLHVAGGR